MKRQLTLAIGAALLGLCGSAFAITDTETNASIPDSSSPRPARAAWEWAARFSVWPTTQTAAYTSPIRPV